MNTQTHSNGSQKKQILTLIWLIFLISTLSLPAVVIIGLSRTYDPSLESDFAGYLMLTIGIILFIISHIIFKKVSSRPIDINKFQIPFTISCVFAEAITIIGLLQVQTSNLDKFAYGLFCLGFLAVLMKKPKLDLIVTDSK